MQREQSSEVVTLYQQLPPFSYASGLTATEAEILGVMTTESAVDLQPFSASFTLRPPHAPYEACSGLDGTLGACADSADPMLLHEGLHAFHDTPPINFLNGVNDIPDTTLGLRCEATYHFPNDILTAGNGIESVLIPQPNINYSMFLNGSTPGEATWLSPRLYAQVVELTSQYASTLHIERSGPRAVSPVRYWEQKYLVDIKVLLSCALFCNAYRDIISGEAVNDHHYLKGRFLRLINIALEDPVQAISDSNLAAIISLCMFENVRGTEVAVVHLQGLWQMINMRGGIHSLPTDRGQDVSEMALLQDMIHAACSDCPPIMFNLLAPILGTTSKPGGGNRYPQSPLHVINDTRSLRPILESQSSFRILEDAFNVFKMICIEAFGHKTISDEAEVFVVHPESIWARLETSNEGVHEELLQANKERAGYAIMLAAKIHYRAVVRRVQHKDDLNTKDVMGLHGIVRQIDLGFWKVAHHVYLWILLTGGAACCNKPILRSYFVSEILRLGLSIGVLDWQSFRQTISNFLWLQQYLRKGTSSLSVNEIASG